MAQTDEFQNWRDALAGNATALHADIPNPGYYKVRAGKDGPWQPVAIWRKDGNLVCRVAGEMKDPLEVWTWAAKNPVSKEAAKHAFEHGTWPGDVPMPGHNSGTLSLPEEIDDAVAQVSAWLSSTRVADKVAADTASNWRARLLDLSKRADKQRETEKRPHDDAAKAVQAKWKPVIDRATDTANKLRDALTAYMRAEDERQRREAEAARKVAEEAARKQREAAEAARREAAAKNAPPPPEPEDVPLPFVEPPRVQVGGQTGRKTGLREVTRYEVEDYEAALAAVKDHPDVRAAVEKVAAARCKTGVAVPGVRTFKEKVAA